MLVISEKIAFASVILYIVGFDDECQMEFFLSLFFILIDID